MLTKVMLGDQGFVQTNALLKGMIAALQHWHGCALYSASYESSTPMVSTASISTPGYPTTFIEGDAAEALLLSVTKNVPPESGS